MLYTGYLIIVNGQKMKFLNFEFWFEKFPFLSCKGWKIA